MATSDDYAVYQGPLGSFDDHAAIACSTGGAQSLRLPPPEQSVFWLVVPVDPESGAEGSYGQRSDGGERSPAAAACFTQLVGDPICP